MVKNAMKIPNSFQKLIFSTLGAQFTKNQTIRWNFKFIHFLKTRYARYLRLEDKRLELVRRDLDWMQNTGLGSCLVCITHPYMPSALLRNWWCTNLSLFRALTELLKQPGEPGGVDRGGGHHPIGSNGISGRSMRTNNGESEPQSLCWAESQVLTDIMNVKSNIMNVKHSVLR